MMHDCTGELVDQRPLLSAEAQDFNGIVSSFQFCFVINAGHSDHTHADQGEVVGVGGDQTHLNDVRFVVGHHLEEDVVTSLCSKLVGHSRLLQKICLNISTGQFTR